MQIPRYRATETPKGRDRIPLDALRLDEAKVAGLCKLSKYDAGPRCIRAALEKTVTAGDPATLDRHLASLGNVLIAYVLEGDAGPRRTQDVDQVEQLARVLGLNSRSVATAVQNVLANGNEFSELTAQEQTPKVRDALNRCVARSNPTLAVLGEMALGGCSTRAIGRSR
jgi:hypothetical protein